MLVKVVLHGMLKKLFPEMEVDGATPAEILEGWSRQTSMEDMPLDKRPVIDVLGFDSENELMDQLPEGTTELHLVPAMFGGGGAVGKILIGAALIGLSFIPGIGQVAQVALLSAGIGMAMGGVMQMFMRSPKMDSKSSTDDGSKYINGATNSTAIGTRIGYGGGRMRVGGQFLSLQVNSSDMVYGQFPATVPA